MFTFSDDFRRNLPSHLESYTTDEVKIEKGIDLLEKFINIEIPNDTFCREVGEALDAYLLSDKSKSMGNEGVVEFFFKKLVVLLNKGKGNEMLKELYGLVGFNELAAEECFESYRERDRLNKWKKNGIDYKGTTFRFSKDYPDGNKEYINLKYYEDCPPPLESYIKAYYLRNKSSHASQNKDSANYKDVYVVYLDQCLRHEEEIEKKFQEYLKELLHSHYKQHAKHQIHEKNNFKDHIYVELKWLDDDGLINLEACNCIKFIGEAGVGKTTQMKELYRRELESVLNENKEILPIWINAMDMREAGDTLEKFIAEQLGEIKSLWKILLKDGRISIYLDGYNELISEKREIKSKLAFDIDEIHSLYPNTPIYMTDRSRVSSPGCLETDVTVCHFEGMSRKEIEDYCDAYLVGNQKAIDAKNYYFNSTASEWIIGEKRKPVIPQKLSMLIELFKSDNFVNDVSVLKRENELYNMYLTIILDREDKIKKDHRVSDLKIFCCDLANKYEDADDGWVSNSIITFWSEKNCGNNKVYAREVFDLAKALPILVEDHGVWKFRYTQYYNWFKHFIY